MDFLIRQISLAAIVWKNLFTSKMEEPSPKKLKKDDRHPADSLRALARKLDMPIDSLEFARYMDENDPIRHLRKEFHYPKMKELHEIELELVDPEEECVYFCGNSLGLCPKKAKEYVNVELEKWAQTGVQGHTRGDLPWAYCDEKLDASMAKLVGGHEGEVGIMNGLTVNLHLLLISFYRPTPKRYKILCESKAFPSDHYAFSSQIRLHGYDPEKAMVCVEPRKGEYTLRLEDILAKIEEEGDSIAVVCFSGVQYYTGQLFDIPTITKAGHNKGCIVGWDLAHAAGNVELKLHDWDVDFACWCSYKYINSSAGGLSSIFLHEKHRNHKRPILEGWWGHQYSTRFEMNNTHDLIPGAYAYRISNTPGLLCATLKASLEIFNKTSMDEIVAKSRLLTGYLEMRIKKKFPNDPSCHTDGTSKDFKHVSVNIFTPSDTHSRGAQLSLSFSVNITHVFEELQKRGVVCDERKPSVIRIAPAPLYCSFEDVHRFMIYLEQALKAAAGYSKR